jgi:hypothetical protein
LLSFRHSDIALAFISYIAAPRRRSPYAHAIYGASRCHVLRVSLVATGPRVAFQYLPFFLSFSSSSSLSYSLKRANSSALMYLSRRAATSNAVQCSFPLSFLVWEVVLGRFFLFSPSSSASILEGSHRRELPSRGVYFSDLYALTHSLLFKLPNPFSSRTHERVTLARYISKTRMFMAP